jgi:hypothetical protein
MQETREFRIKRLLTDLTPQQIEDLQIIIETADVQSDWIWDGENSVCADDVHGTLGHLARELEDKYASIHALS